MAHAMQTDSIACILQEIQHGSSEAAERLYAEYQPLVMRVIRRHLSRNLRRLTDSVDFSQAVWKTIFEHAAYLQSLDAPEAIAAYIAQVASNKVHSEVRSQYSQKRDLRRISNESEGNADRLPTRDPTPSQTAMAHERLDAINSDLTAIQQQMIQLRIDGFNIEEIAKTLQINERTVRRVLKRISDSHE